ncbi:MAG: indolepyruvate oxidoreductase subunit beta [Candidatus Nealsonbacteria bacterium]|nr:MAG: indolepyruvate oxidoreductase subunit beta [Candidatus Nealsonbacteria bacterium]
MEKDFNIIISGVGGQGIITLTRILAEAALIEKKDVKTSELHGLSQRGGSVETHIRFGKEVYSPLVRQAGADLIISLEAQEALKSCYYGSRKRTVFLVNEFVKPIFGSTTIPLQKIKKELEKFSKKVILIPATRILKEKLNNPILAGIYLLGYANCKKLIPLKERSVSKALEKVIPKEYLSINKQAFNLGKKYESCDCSSRSRDSDASSN